MRIVIPMAPPKELLPNHRRRNHWSIEATGSKLLRRASWAAATNCKPDWWEPIGRFTATITVCYEHRGKNKLPDLDGTLNACKPAIDGLEDAGIIQNDRLAEEYTIRQTSADEGQIIIEIEEVTECEP